jgi:hypothetical protein
MEGKVWGGWLCNSFVGQPFQADPGRLALADYERITAHIPHHILHRGQAAGDWMNSQIEEMADFGVTTALVGATLTRCVSEDHAETFTNASG